MADPLYQAALALCQTKLWQRLGSTQVFSVCLPGDEPAYCALFSKGLTVYPGQAGLDTLRKLAEAGEAGRLAEYSLQCVFTGKNQLNGEEQERTRRAAEAMALKERGLLWPAFRQSRPCRIPWPLNGKAEGKPLLEALKAAVYVAKQLGSATPAQLGFAEDLRPGTVIPCLQPLRTGYRWALTMLPPAAPEVYPRPLCGNVFAAERIRRRRKNGVLKCGVVCLPETAGEEAGAAIPAALVGFWSPWGQPVATDPVAGYEENADRILADLLQWLDRSGRAPESFMTPDGRTDALLSDLSRRSEIPLQRSEELPELLGMSDRILIMKDGKVNGEFTRSESLGEKDLIAKMI